MQGSLRGRAVTQRLRRTITTLDLTLIGVGGIVGTGVFVLTGHAAAFYAGPAVALSFVLGGLAASLAAMCYAEAASTLPSAGGAYTYVRVAMGRLAGWIVGWDLLLEYFIGNAVVSVGWAAYLTSFLRHTLGLRLDPRWTEAPIGWNPETHALHWTGSFVNLPALSGLVVVAGLLSFGLRETVRVNGVLVALKLGAILLFIAFAAPLVRLAHWTPFIPPNEGTLGAFGPSGIIKGTTVVFFSFVGFDALATTGQELKDPRRGLPRSIFLSLGICTAIYVACALVLTGIVPYTSLGVANPISFAARQVGPGWLPTLIDIGAMAGLSSSIVMGVMAQPRIVYAMANDGLLPAAFGRIHPRRNSPVLATVACGCLCGLVAGFVPIEVLNELVSVGTLLGFGAVSVAVILLRRRHPTTPGAFRIRGGAFGVPLASALLCAGLVASSGWSGISRVAAWLLLGLGIYAVMRRRQPTPSASVVSTPQLSKKVAS
jgi:APA family basic amino acid/polyamine antiporter